MDKKQWKTVAISAATLLLLFLLVGRKNWLFANTPGGAQASSVIYSLIETAKENGLDPYRYLLWVLRNAPVLGQTDESWAEKLLPSHAPQECCTPQK